MVSYGQRALARQVLRSPSRPDAQRFSSLPTPSPRAQPALEAGVAWEQSAGHKPSCVRVRARPRVLGSDSDENIWAPGARVSASTMDHNRLQSPLPVGVIASWLNRSRPAIQPQHAAKNVLARLRSERDADKGSPSR